MSAQPMADQSNKANLEMFCDDPHSMAPRPLEELFSFGRAQLDQIQLAGLRKRFAELSPKLPRLKKLTQENRVTALKDINEVVPLLFPHTEYKSYPMSLIDNCRFEQLNAWLDDFTTHDLSGLDVSGCQSLSEWLAVVEAKTPLRVLTSSGTSGKISILPRSTAEDKYITAAFSAVYRKFRAEQGLADIYAPNVYHVFPFARRGRHITNHVIRAMTQHGFHGDESHVLSFDGEMSTDLLWMTGRMKKAQADGTIEQLRKTKAWQRLSGRLGELEANRADTQEAFYRDMLVRLKDKTVVMSLGLNYFQAMVECAEKHGLEIRFAPDSFLTAAGGLKGVTLTEAQIEKIKKTIPHHFHDVYASSELFSGLARKCTHDRFHTPPWLVNFVLNPDTGVPYPRQGTQTGRYAGFDLWATTYWGGFISGDEVTMNWDGGCDCGREGPYLHDKIVRYTTKRGGDDKITCQRTAEAAQELTDQMRTP